MALAHIAFLMFVVFIICGISDSATIYTRPKGNVTEEDIGAKDTVNANNWALAEPEGTSIQGEIKVQDAKTVICPRGYEPVEIYCYKINLQRGEQRQHQDLCFQSGGYLIEIETSEENTVLTNYMRSLNLESQQEGLYIGFINIHWGTNLNQLYSWMNTAGFPFSDWAAGNPNGRECGFMFLSGDLFGKWATGFCQRLRGAICEADPLAKFSVAVTV